VSTKRTVVQFIAGQAVAGAEALDLVLDPMLLGLEPRELGLASGERTQVLGDERTDRAAAFGCLDTRRAVDVTRHGVRDVLHAGSLSRDN